MTNVATKLFDLSRRVPDYTQRNVFETLAVLGGVKKVLRLVISVDHANHVCSAVERQDLVVARAPWRLRPVYRTSLKDIYTEIADDTGMPGESLVLAVAKDKSIAERYLKAEEHDDVEEVGHLLGYPPCCVRSYDNLSNDRDWLTEMLSNTTFLSRYPFQNNRLSYLFDDRWIGFDYFPCSLNCRRTSQIFETMAEVLRGQKLGALVRKVESLMKTPILIRKGVIIQLTGAIVQGHSLRYKLHNAKLFGWKTSDHADEDPIWETDGLIRESESLKFFHKRQFITSWREEQMDNRLLAFE